jgi:hypothetical protein
MAWLSTMETQWVPYPLTLARTFDQLSQEEELEVPSLIPSPPGVFANPTRISAIPGSVSQATKRGTDTLPTEDGKADRPLFLVGEEVLDEIGLSDGKEIFINDVLETAEWYVL